MKSLRTNPRPEHRRTGNAFIIVSMFISLSILSLIRAKYCATPYHHVKPEVAGEVKATMEPVQNLSENSRDLAELEDEDDEKQPLCIQTTKRSKICEAEGDIRVKASSQTVLLDPSITHREWKNKPYSRHHDPHAMQNIKEWTLKPLSEDNNTCTTNHTVPALIFSVGGFTGNLFHDFTDVLVPLFISAYQFKGEVQFIIADVKPWWVNKFTPVLRQLTNYEFIDANEDTDQIRCFPNVVLGLDFHKELGVDPSKTPGNYSVIEFRKTLRTAFGLERSVSEPSGEDWDIRQRPRLLIVSRKKSRVFLNERGMTDMAMSLGFDVRIAEPEITSDISKFARLVNSADVMIGVHGAGLTNMVFLPAGAVLIQVVPMGALEWLARDTFGKPAPEMELNYLEYKIQYDESTLSQQYGKDDPVISDPLSVHKKGWNELSKTYLENQNVRPHLGRLRNTLLEALKFLPHSKKALAAH